MKNTPVSTHAALRVLSFLSTLLFLFFCILIPYAYAVDAKITRKNRQTRGFNTVKFNAPPAEKIDFSLGEPNTDPLRDWTMIIYMDGDNDLEPFALADINEMESGIRSNIEIIVLVDRAKGYDKSDGNWQDARIYRIRKDDNPKRIGSDILAKPGELNLGEGNVLESFLSSAIRTFPARHYALVMWDHGGGWAAHANDHDAPTSPTGRDYLTLHELSNAIRNVLKNTEPKKIDLIGFDMCLMAQLETAVELEGLAEVMVASQAVEPGDGWPYTEILPEFAKGTQGTRRIASSIVQIYGKFYEKRDTAISTLSAVDLTYVSDTMKALDDVADKLNDKLDSSWPTVSRALFFSEAYAARTEVQRGKHALASVDLMDALKRMQINMKDFPAHQEYNALVSIFDRFIIATHTSPARRLSNGIAIYAPVTAERFNNAYRQTRFSKESRWAVLLENLHKHQARDQSKPIIRDLQLVNYDNNKIVPIPVARPLSTHGILYTVEGKNILWISGMVGERAKDGNSMLVYTRSTVLDANWHKRTKDRTADKVDLVIPEYADGVNQRIIMYSGYRYAVTNGKKSYYATVEMPLQAGYMSIPILYSHPSTGSLGGTVYFNPRWWYSTAVVLELPQKDGTTLFRQIKPAPDAEITTLFESISNTGKLRYLKGGTMKWGEGLELLLSLYSPGTYEVALTAEAISGQSDTVFFSFGVEKHPTLSQVLERGSKYNKNDLIGTWVYINPNKFRDSNQMVPLGVEISFSQHPQKKGLLVSEFFKTNQPGSKQRSIVFPDSRMLSHIRMFPLEKAEKPEDYLKSNTTSVYLTAMFQNREGIPMLLQQNILTMGIYMAYKRREAAGPRPDSPPTGAHSQQPPGGQGTKPPPSSRRQGISGIWQSADGETLLIRGNQYQLSQFGQAVDAGNYQVRANMLIFQSGYTGMSMQFAFRLQGNVLLLKDEDGEVFQYFRKPG